MAEPARLPTFLIDGKNPVEKEVSVYSNKPLMNDNRLDGDDEADQKTVEWLRRQIEAREQKRSAASTG